MTTDLVAFLDESKKPVRNEKTGLVSDVGNHYVVAAAVVLEGDLSNIRAALQQAREKLGYPIHYADLRSRKRRLQTIAAISSINGWDGHVFETGRPLPDRHYNEHHIRAKILTQAFTHLGTEGGVARAVLETRAHPGRGLHLLDKKDHQVLERLLSQKALPGDFRIQHKGKGDEAILQIADVLAGARSDYLCGADREAYPLLAHRVNRPVTAFPQAP